MYKFKQLLLFIITLFFLVGCSYYHNITKKEALNLAKPIIDSILKYKKNTNHYPKSLMEIQNFPYKIKPLHTNGKYIFTKRNGIMLYAGGVETGLNPNSGFVYHFMIDFSGSSSSKTITSIFVGFKKDGTYKILYTKMPPFLKQ